MTKITEEELARASHTMSAHKVSKESSPTRFAPPESYKTEVVPLCKGDPVSFIDSLSLRTSRTLYGRIRMVTTDGPNRSAYVVDLVGGGVRTKVAHAIKCGEEELANEAAKVERIQRPMRLMKDSYTDYATPNYPRPQSAIQPRCVGGVVIAGRPYKEKSVLSEQSDVHVLC